MSIGLDTASLSPEETFARLRKAGLAAEQTMLAATGGINTHKGIIFLMGVLCGAVGRLWNAAEPCRDAEALCKECSRMADAPLRAEFDEMREQNVNTAGAKFYLQYGLRGARGEVMDGLPGVWKTALPALKAAFAAGCCEEKAAAIALLHLIVRGTDTNMVKRGGLDGAAWGADAVRRLLEAESIPSEELISTLDKQFIERNLSPGGCADLLAAALFLRRWEMSE